MPFVHFFSPFVCQRPGPRAVPRRGGEQRGRGGFYPPEESSLLGLGQLHSGQGLLGPLRPPGWGWFLCALCACLGEHIFVHQLLTDPSYGGPVLPSQSPTGIGESRGMNTCHQMLQVPCPADGESTKEGERIGEGFMGEVKGTPRTPGWQEWVLSHLVAKIMHVSKTELCDPGQVT